MTVLSRTPADTNPIQSSKFLLSFNRLPNVTYFCQEANLPGVELSSLEFSTPLLDVPVAGNKLSYNEFIVEFIVDEQLQSWKDIYTWLLAIAAPTSIKDRTRNNALQNTNSIKTSYYSDSSIIIMSALNNPLIRVNYQRMFPTFLSDIKFDTKASADTIITATAKFRYEYFEIAAA